MGSGDQDDELAQPRRQHAAVAQVLSESADPGQQFRALEQRNEGTERLGPSQPPELFNGLLLHGRHAAGTPFFSRSSIAATKVSISSSGV